MLNWRKALYQPHSNISMECTRVAVRTLQPSDLARSKSFVPPAFSSARPTLDKLRIAVLPLQNMSPDPNDEYFALWFTLLNWIHDGLHNTGAMPPNWMLLAFTEYMFHVPWLIFGLALVFVIRQLVKVYKK